MATVCCDTSFLFSLYARDAHTARAVAAVTKLGQPLTLTLLNEFELLNAVRFAVFRQFLPPSAGADVIAAFESDLATGRLVIDPTNLTLVVTEAKRLSSTRTQAGGHRSFDLLHVAAAVHLSAGNFLTFDSNQRTLAKAAGLRVGP